MDKLRILYDHQIFSLQALGGISRYYVAMIDRFERQPDMEVRVAAGEVLTFDLRPTKTYRKANPSSSAIMRSIYAWTKAHGKVDLMYWTNMRRSLRAVEKGDYDVLHPTYYDPYFLTAIGKRPFYLEVHDMIHELHPEFFSPTNKTTSWKRALVDRADRIVTVSDSTRRDLIALMGIEPTRVRTIRQGISLRPELSGPGDAPSHLPKEYILFVGGRSGYKNFRKFAEAIAPLLAKDPELHLVCAGGAPFTGEDVALTKELGIDGRVKQFSVNDRAMCQIYMRARAFVFPSLYEGFGLPILEAFACGCPAVLAETSSLPEIGGDAASYFPPTDVSSMREAIARVIDDDTVRTSMIARGQERARLFSWDRTTEETKRVYLEMVGQS
jgi:glycosyltransferase involved in cell wall biosynthesis